MTKKLLKFLSIGFGALICLLIVACVGLMFFTDSMVGSAISAGASRALGVGVLVKDIQLAPLGGQITFNNVVVENPEGYENTPFLLLKQGTITINTKTLLAKTIHVKQVDLNGMKVVMQQKGLTSNVQEVVDYIHARSESQSSEKTMVIDELNISEITVHIKLPLWLGKTRTIPVKLAPIQMADLGKQKPISTAQLTSQIILAIAEGIFGQVFKL